MPLLIHALNSTPLNLCWCTDEWWSPIGLCGCNYSPMLYNKINIVLWIGFSPFVNKLFIKANLRWGVMGIGGGGVSIWRCYFVDRKSHYKVKTASRPSYEPITLSLLWKSLFLERQSVYWDGVLGAQNPFHPLLFAIKDLSWRAILDM